MARILCFAPSLSGNPVYTPWQVAGALGAGGHVASLAGPEDGGGPWPPLAAELASARRLPGRWAGLPAASEARRLAERADAVYAFKALPTSLGVGLRARDAAAVPLLLHLDDWDAGFFEGRGALRRLWYGARAWNDPRGDLHLRRLERRIGEVDALTVSTRALQRRFGGTLVRQGVDTGAWDPARFPREEARRRLGVPEGEPMVLFLGSPRPHKGLAHLATAGWGSRLWLVGAPAPALREAGVPSTLVTDSTVRGPVPFRDAPWYLAACDVFVVPQCRTPYAEHQLPAKILQAMALGCAVVSTDVGDAGDLLGGEPPAGAVVPPDEPGALRSAVEALLARPERARALGREARDRSVAGLGWGAMAERLEPVLMEVLSRG